MPYVGEQLRPNVIFFMRFKVEVGFENRSELWRRRWDVLEEVESWKRLLKSWEITLSLSFCVYNELKPQTCESRKQERTL